MKKVLLYTKSNPWCDKVVEYCNKNFEVVTEPQSVDYVISFLSPWILPKDILICAKYHALNFHPGSHEYPGIGCYNFALFKGANPYGCVCHEMLEKVDSGTIYAEKLFWVDPKETVQSLQEKTMLYMLVLFYEVMARLILYDTLDPSDVDWSRTPYTHKDLSKLCEFNTDYDLKKWYNACYYPGGKDKPHIIIDGIKYYIIREDHYDSGSNIPFSAYNATT